MNIQYTFDAFLSYKSEDYAFAALLRDALQRRGVRVWLDRDQIGVSERFVTKLEHGLENSRALVRIVTPESVGSNWIEDEFAMAKRLANEGQLRIIPLILRETMLSGFMANHQAIDFQDPLAFEQKVDELVWPGITGRRVVFAPFPYCVGTTRGKERKTWHRLIDAGKKMGLWFLLQDRVYRVVNGEYSLLSAGARTVVVANIFDKTDHYLEATGPYHQTYSEFIIDLRERTHGTDDKVLFLMYHSSTAWDSPEASMLSKALVNQFRRYFTLNNDIRDDGVFADAFAEIWRDRIQPELLKTEAWRARRPRET